MGSASGWLPARNAISHHFAGVLRKIKANHLFVEFLRLGCWDADCIDVVRHEHAVHHETHGAFIAVEEELLQSAK